jgi:hypothetical protein
MAPSLDGMLRFYEARPLFAAAITTVFVFAWIVLSRKRWTLRWRVMRLHVYRLRRQWRDSWSA